QGGDLQPRLQAPDRKGRLRARGHHLRPQHPPHRHRHRGARRLREEFHRRDAGDQEALPPGPRLRWRLQPLFSFRGNDRVREAIHSAFLYHAIRAGLDMGIVNAGQLVVYEDIPKDLLELVEDVIFDRRTDATERLVEFAKSVSGAGSKREVDLTWREGSIEERLKHAVLHGEVEYI